MKHCKKSHKCPYGNAFEKNVCAYDENLNEYDVCPYLLENWDYIIDELTKDQKFLDNNRQSLMLYNDVVLDLNSFSMDNYRNSDISSVWNSLIKIESY